MIHPRRLNAAACDGVTVVGVQLAQLQGNSHATASRCSNRSPPVSLHQTSRFLEELHVNKSTMSSAAAATVPPQLSRDDARAMCAPANNLNAGFLQFETAHEGGGGECLRALISHTSLRRNAPSLFPNLLTHRRSLRASSRHFPPRIKRIRGAQLRVRHPTHAAGAGARGDGGANARHRGACNSSREFCDPHLQVPAHFIRFI